MVLSYDVTEAILSPQKNETTVRYFSKAILWELNSFLYKKLSFAAAQLHGCSAIFPYVCRLGRTWEASMEREICYSTNKS